MLLIALFALSFIQPTPAAAQVRSAPAGVYGSVSPAWASSLHALASRPAAASLSQALPVLTSELADPALRLSLAPVVASLQTRGLTPATVSVADLELAVASAKLLMGTEAQALIQQAAAEPPGHEGLPEATAKLSMLQGPFAAYLPAQARDAVRLAHEQAQAKLSDAQREKMAALLSRLAGGLESRSLVEALADDGAVPEAAVEPGSFARRQAALAKPQPREEEEEWTQCPAGQPKSFDYHPGQPILLRLGRSAWLEVRSGEDAPPGLAPLPTKELFLFDPLDASRYKPLEDGQALELGRGQDEAFALSGSTSRRHARLSRQGSRVVVEDLGSRNGTWAQELPKPAAAPAAPPLQTKTLAKGGSRLVELAPEEQAQLTLAGVAPFTLRRTAEDRLELSGESGSLSLAPGETASLGRASHNSLVARAQLVSRDHAQVRYLGGGRFEVADRGSTHGTGLRGVGLPPPERPAPLQKGQARTFQLREKDMLLLRLSGPPGSAPYLRLSWEGGGWNVTFGKQVSFLRPGERLRVGRLPPEVKGERRLTISPWQAQVSRDHLSIEAGDDGLLRLTLNGRHATEVSRALRASVGAPGRQQGVLGRIYASDVGLWGGLEILRIDPQDPELLSAYEAASARARSRGGTEKAVLEAVFKVLHDEMPYDKQHAAELEQNNLNSMDLGAASLKGRSGVCRHQAVAAAAVLELFSAAGLLKGQVYYVIGAEHAWAEYVAADGTSQVLDLAQNGKVVGSERAFDGDGKGRRYRYAQFSFPASSR